ncbi:methyl-accepting chemotaxis protein [Psychrobacillus sp. NPDC093180]|uniref:methyl-accepting chemotaxis protein n=1 Tax=Psychrobacillus sp. NPDC093180 TaxID=3364489 RepID=UPI0038033800
MKMTIAKKMWLGFSAILLLLIVSSVVAFVALSNNSAKYQFLLDNQVVKLDLLKQIEITQKDAGRSLLDYLLLNTDTSRQSVGTNLELASSLNEELHSKLSTPETLELMEKLNRKNVVYQDKVEEVIAAKQNKETTVNKLTSEVKTMNLDMLKILQEIEQFLKTDMEQTREDVNRTDANAKLLILLIGVVSIILGLAVSYFISKSISKPVKKVTAGLSEIAIGNLAVEPILIKNKDEVGEMAKAFNTMSADLRQVVSSVRDSSMQLAANAEELSASSEESLASSQLVAKSAEEQMATSEQQVRHMDSSVNSMDELSQGIVQISVDNEEMLHAADDVTKLVKKGSEVVSDVAGQMNMIHTTFKDTTVIMQNMAKHSNEIQAVTSLITDISEQTNLLALNAAIEAARAGEYGKGFAVVAEEVRKLAEQSKNSASEIEKMIEMIQTASGDAVKAITVGGDKVEDGLSKTTESLQVFTEIESAVGVVGSKIESVSASIEQIQAMAESVSEGALEVQRLATQVADGANDTSAATEEQLATNEEISSNAQVLADLAEKLQNNVRHFKLS